MTINHISTEQAIQAYQNGSSIRTACDQFGVDYRRLKRELAERGLLLDIQATRKRAAAAGKYLRCELPIDQIVERYQSGESENAIARSFGVTRMVIRKRLLGANIPIRDITAANRLMMANRSPEEHQLFTAAAHEAARNRTPTPEELAKAAKTRERRMMNVSPAELLLREWLLQRGIESIPQKAVGQYNIDLAVPPIAIEIYGGGWHAWGEHARVDNERIPYLIANGWRIAIVWVNKRGSRLLPTLVDALLQFMATDAPIIVLRGTGEILPSDHPRYVQAMPSSLRATR